eukprot:m.167286 g.167286  ORF g.167286 m.167286 type:complete len:729 (+) comp31460_c5_seq3:522-2708(+)
MFGHRKAGSTVKKLKLKNFVALKLPSSFNDDIWKTLRDAVQAIQHQRPVQDTLEHLYKGVENYCDKASPEELYSNLQNVCKEHMARELKGVLKYTGGDPKTFLGYIDKIWQAHCDQMVLIRSIFNYLDRVYAHTTSGVDTLWNMGLVLFRTHVVGNSLVLNRITPALLGQVRSERDGELVDRAQIKRLILMLVDLELYGSQFEQAFLIETKQYYAVEAKRKLDTEKVLTFLIYAESRLEEEGDRVEQYADISTQKAAMNTIEQEILVANVPNVLSKGLTSMLTDDRHTDLSRLYRLCKRVACLPQLQKMFVDYMLDRGKEIVTHREKDPTMVEDLLALKSKVGKIVKESFSSHENFVNAVKLTFGTIINLRANKPAEMIAKFFDSKLRTGYKECTPEGLDALFDELLTLFRFINGKDMFEGYYKMHLSRRLLLQKSASDDAELSILSKLKQECGSAFTCNLEGMFKDINLSSGLTSSFYQTLRRKSDSKIELSVNVLTAAHWPTYASAEVRLPSEMLQLQDLFATFYHSKHGNRKLTWENSLGHCLVTARFPKGAKDLQISTYQGLVLLGFNDVDTLSFKDIYQLTGIKEDELARVLQSLACAKIRVLTKTPKSRDVNDTDTFTFNAKFENKHKRIKINQIQMKESEVEQEETQEKVFQDRVFAVDAAIVRVMKSRKTIKHNNLISELFEQLKFPAKPSDLKKRIDSLLEREYMERDKTDASTYNYVA